VADQKTIVGGQVLGDRRERGVDEGEASRRTVVFGRCAGERPRQHRVFERASGVRIGQQVVVHRRDGVLHAIDDVVGRPDHVFRTGQCSVREHLEQALGG
jgi:hypothetical protein